MANFTIQDIQELREFTGAGMLDVKNALTEAQGDRSRAIELIRIKGLKGLAKREDRETTEGLVVAKVVGEPGAQFGYLAELNCETDFVAKNEKFIAMAQTVIDYIAKFEADNVTSALEIPTETAALVDFINQTAAVFNEKVVLKSVSRLDAAYVTVYLHKHSNELPPYLGTLLGHSELPESVAKALAQHVAGLAPKFFSKTTVPTEVLESEERVAREIAAKENKPENIIPKIVEGRLNVFYKENVFLEQPLAKDPTVIIKDLLKQNSGEVLGYARLAVGEPSLTVSG
ncbi:MAG: translation elongation factor Ts [Bifidobacteriaceae bacterium]|jgi:elongation factor Ts|nr:translation elongation factor Ts [Bifidobacteriaceae bacterium]